MIQHKTSCRAYGNYQPPYEDCTCGAEKKIHCAVCGDEIPDDPIADALAKQECFDLFGCWPGDPGAPSVDVVCDACFPSFARWMGTKAKES